MLVMNEANSAINERILFLILNGNIFCLSHKSITARYTIYTYIDLIVIDTQYKMNNSIPREI